MDDTPFRGFIGQERWQRYFATLVAQNRLGHAYLFSGPAHIGKRTFTDHLAHVWLCEGRGAAVSVACGTCRSCLAWRQGDSAGHPEVVELSLASGERSIGIDDVREFIAVLGQTPTFARGRIGFIADGERLTAESANALLKIIEEPPVGVTVIVLASSAFQLPATVRSRLQHALFAPVPRATLAAALLESRDTSRATAEEVAALSGGRPGLALAWLSDRKALTAYRARAQAFLALCRGSLGDRFAFTEKVARSDDLPVRELWDLLDHWQLVLRDLFLTASNEPGLAAHVGLAGELRDLATGRAPSVWRDRYRALELARFRLDRNANRRLALNCFLTTLSF